LEQALKIRDDGPYKDRHGKYSFLYEAYEPHTWWFEVFECIRRLLLTAGLLVLSPGTAVQISVAMVICLLSMRVYAQYAPFINPRDDILAEIMQWQIFFTMFGALLMKANKADETTEDEATVQNNNSIIGFLLCAINAIGPTMIIIHSIVSGEAKQQMLDKYSALKEKAMKVLVWVPIVGKRATAVVYAMEEQALEQEARMKAKASEASARKGETILAVLLEKHYNNDVNALWQSTQEKEEEGEGEGGGGGEGEEEEEKKVEEDAEEKKQGEQDVPSILLSGEIEKLPGHD
jgi:hypothetical protein